MNWPEGLALFDAELARLPHRYQAVLIACCLEGRSRDEAARELGWNASKVKGLLERGRDLLRRRLARRGFDLGVLLAATAARSGSSIPLLPIEACVEFAQGRAPSGVLPVAAALSERVVLAMLIRKVKTVAVLLLAIALAAGGSFAHRVTESTEVSNLDSPLPAPLDPGRLLAPVPRSATSMSRAGCAGHVDGRRAADRQRGGCRRTAGVRRSGWRGEPLDPVNGRRKG